MDASLRGQVARSLAALLPDDGVLVLDTEDDASEIDELLTPAPGGRGIYLRDPSIRAAAA